jgi:hypothetical protein
MCLTACELVRDENRVKSIEISTVVMIAVLAILAY